MKKFFSLLLLVSIPLILPSVQAGNLDNVLHSCNNPGNTFAYSTSWSNDTHYMDNTDCKMILIDNDPPHPSENISDATIFDISDLQFTIIILAIIVGIILFLVIVNILPLTIFT